MIAQTRAEFLKIRSTRTTLGLVLGMILVVLLFVLLGGLLTKVQSLGEEAHQRDLLGTGGAATLFAALAGVLVVTSEYRFGTIRPTFLFTPRRSRVVGAKAVAALVAGLAFGVAAEALSFGIGYAIIAARGVSLSLGSGDLALLGLGTLAGTALWGAIGVGLGAVLRHQIGAVVGLLVWAFVVENIVFSFVPSVGRFAPGLAQTALTGSTQDHLLPAAAGGAVFLAWTVGLVAAGITATARRDVT